jgi:hypothetical protein
MRRVLIVFCLFIIFYSLLQASYIESFIGDIVPGMADVDSRGTLTIYPNMGAVANPLNIPVSTQNRVLNDMSNSNVSTMYILPKLPPLSESTSAVTPAKTVSQQAASDSSALEYIMKKMKEFGVHMMKNGEIKETQWDPEWTWESSRFS